MSVKVIRNVRESYKVKLAVCFISVWHGLQMVCVFARPPLYEPGCQVLTNLIKKGMSTAAMLLMQVTNPCLATSKAIIF